MSKSPVYFVHDQWVIYDRSRDDITAGSRFTCSNHEVVARERRRSPIPFWMGSFVEGAGPKLVFVVCALEVFPQLCRTTRRTNPASVCQFSPAETQAECFCYDSYLKSMADDPHLVMAILCRQVVKARRPGRMDASPRMNLSRPGLPICLEASTQLA